MKSLVIWATLMAFAPVNHAQTGSEQLPKIEIENNLTATPEQINEIKSQIKQKEMDLNEEDLGTTNEAIYEN